MHKNRIKYKANMIKNAVHEFCHTEDAGMEQKAKMADIYSAFCDIMEELDLYDEVIEEKEYFVLPVDQFCQPVGYVVRQMLSPFEASITPYCFEDEYAAEARAQN